MFILIWTYIRLGNYDEDKFASIRRIHCYSHQHFNTVLAFAVCPKGAEPKAAQAAYDIVKGRKPATHFALDIIKLADQCPNDAIVLLYSAEVLLRVPIQKDKSANYPVIAHAWKYLQTYEKIGGVKSGALVRGRQPSIYSQH